MPSEMRSATEKYKVRMLYLFYIDMKRLAVEVPLFSRSPYKEVFLKISLETTHIGMIESVLSMRISEAYLQSFPKNIEKDCASSEKAVSTSETLTEYRLRSSTTVADFNPLMPGGHTKVIHT